MHCMMSFGCNNCEVRGAESGGALPLNAPNSLTCAAAGELARDFGYALFWRCTLTLSIVNVRIIS